ncbi:RNA polymerase sigma factor [Allorhodopirellula heiligendammensis]|uniref:ECF RNA polymerase sigma factor SigK n=1 Tax=Allorhodopirellula heiligendammensis TaxID=2714739 RepID=A0A5C6BDL9_9BACT|nr:sigma-70 family RNA polymerase sigma factor [Allorhodopirellula heiligendammensis]TWU10223.1 ECF RNA polymerase sigma factor SigK [Allorhodopirellula heiligendammensis]
MAAHKAVEGAIGDVCGANETDDPSEMIARAVDEHQRSLLSYAGGILRDPVAAQDAVQETFLQLCRKARQVASSDEPPTLAEFAARLAPWLFTVCRTRVIDMQRKKTPQSFATRRGFDEQGDSAPEAAVMDPGPTPADAALASEEHRRVADSIGSLTPKQREILQLRMQAGLSYREIADVTGLTTSNVGFHLHQAVASLRDQLVTA